MIGFGLIIVKLRFDSIRTLENFICAWKFSKELNQTETDKKQLFFSFYKKTLNIYILYGLLLSFKIICNFFEMLNTLSMYIILLNVIMMINHALTLLL